MRLDPESQMGLLISKYIDNETTLGEREMVEKHLGACASCRDVVQIFRKNDELLKSALNVEIYGNQIVEKVMDRIEGPRRRWRIREIVRLPYLAGAAAALAIFGLAAVVVVQHSLLSDMTARFDHLSSHVIALDGMRDDMIKTRKDVINQLAMREAIHKFEQDPGTGVLASVLSGHVHLSIKLGLESIDKYQVFRRLTGSANWGEPIATTINREYTDKAVEADRTYEYRVVALNTNGIAVRDAIVKVTVPPELAALKVEDLSNFLKVSCLTVENQVATVIVQRQINGQLRQQTYQIKASQELGSRVPDLAGTQTIDFRTGYTLVAIIDEDQTIGVTSNGDQFTRVNKKLVLKPNGKLNDPTRSVECWAGGEVLIPLPK